MTELSNFVPLFTAIIALVGSLAFLKMFYFHYGFMTTYGALLLGGVLLISNTAQSDCLDKKTKDQLYEKALKAYYDNSTNDIEGGCKIDLPFLIPHAVKCFETEFNKRATKVPALTLMTKPGVSSRISSACSKKILSVLKMLNPIEKKFCDKEIKKHLIDIWDNLKKQIKRYKAKPKSTID